MGFYLTRQTALKWLETPSVYQIARDEVYELDDESFRFLSSCASDGGCDTRESAFIDYCLEEGLLTREKVSLSRPPLRPSPNPSLRYLELQLTSRCTLRCRHCYIGDREPRELTSGQVRSVLREFEEMQGLRVLLTGGEPLLHPQFEEIDELLPDLFLRKARKSFEVLEVSDREIHGISLSIKLPAVMRLLKLVRLKDSHRAVKFSRINIFTRDGYCCQYCYYRFRTEELTFDHVVPIAKGGKKTWENIVTACWRCNNRKSGRTPDEAGMKLKKRPVKSRWSPVITITIGIRNTPECWRDYLYWNMELDADPADT